MSLLLEALKKAEKAKEDAQRRAREGGSAGEELQLAENSPPGDARHVTTRDELPQITAPLEILSEDLRADPARSGARELSLQDAPDAQAARAPTRAAEAAQQRGTARKVFEAKMREPNPRLPFYIVMGALGAFAAGTVIYFWIQLRPQPPIYNANPQPPASEPALAATQPPPQPQSTAPASSSLAAIPGLPPASRPAREPAAAAPPAPAAKPAPRAGAEPAARAAPRPRPRLAVQRARTAAPASVATHRPAPRVNANVASAYAAYQAGDMARARTDYERALRDEPGNRDALLGLAAVETQARRFAAAEALYRRLLLADPRDPYAQASLLALHTQQLDPVSAESRVKGLLAVEPDESVLHFTLGNQYAQQGRWPEARQSYARAVAMDPENPDYAYNFAVSLEHMRQPQLALQHYHRALALALRRTASFDAGAAQLRVQQLTQ